MKMQKDRLCNPFGLFSLSFLCFILGRARFSPHAMEIATAYFLNSGWVHSYRTVGSGSAVTQPGLISVTASEPMDPTQMVMLVGL